MVTLEKIISSNLEMLKSQETELLKSLNFVQKAKKLFQSQNGKPKGKPKGRPKGSVNLKKKSAVRVKATSVKSAKGLPPKDGLGKAGIHPLGEPKAVSQKPKSVRALKPGSHLANIVSVLKEKNTPLKPHELIETLFNQQTKDKNIEHYRSLISPTLSNAYKRGILLRKDGKVLLPA